MTLTEFLAPVLRLIGACLIAQSFSHIHLYRRLKWTEEAAKMTPFSAAVFHVHIFFVCLVLVMMGLPMMIDPGLLLEKTKAGAWAAWMLCAFWATRLYCQCFTYDPSWWKGQKFEMAMHRLFTVIWAILTIIFGLCGAIQTGWLKA
ncbi:hypothetical protein [Haloferula sp. BvORR071]|uniref:hypothetical protein n=1 Tax=Haloferula sp. BvORR071 TaxID=1396141 RepID=UPI000554B40C|nr:hypothetical protein [Haloferula sp. BvORR071]